MIQRWWIVAAAVAGVLVMGNYVEQAFAADTPTIETIMQKVNKRKSGLHDEVNQALKAGKIDWDGIQSKTKEYASLAESLGKNDPPMGGKASWEKLTKEYAANAKALNDAAQKKDKAAAQKAWNTIQNSCMSCHRVHRPMH